MACVGQMNVIIKLNTRDVSIPLKIFAVPAKLYIACLNAWYKLRGKKMYKLTVKIGEKDAYDPLETMDETMDRLKEKLDA
jgi:hypothetical protein